MDAMLISITKSLNIKFGRGRSCTYPLAIIAKEIN